MGFNPSNPHVGFAFLTQISGTSIMEGIFAKIAKDTIKFDIGDDEVKSQSLTGEDTLEADAN